MVMGEPLKSDHRFVGMLAAVVLFGGFVLYAISGFVVSGWLWWRRRRPPA